MYSYTDTIMYSYTTTTMYSYTTTTAMLSFGIRDGLWHDRTLLTWIWRPYWERIVSTCEECFGSLKSYTNTHQQQQQQQQQNDNNRLLTNIYMLTSETLCRGVEWGYFCVYIGVWTYVCHFVFWSLHFCVCLVVYPIPELQNPLVYRPLPVSSNCSLLWIFLPVKLKTTNLPRLNFLLELVVVVK